VSVFIVIMDLYGVIGWPIEHSLSPAMHNAAFKALDIEATYEKIPVKPENLEDFLLNKKEYRGFNITVPHKVKAKEILEKGSPCDMNHPYGRAVALSGAVNTVKRVAGRIEYLNTDVSGFGASLEMNLGFKAKQKNILVIGCGGVSRAIVADLSDPGNHVGKIYLYDINMEAVASMKKHLSGVLHDWGKKIAFIEKNEIAERLEACQLLINATPIGMKEGDPSPIDKKLLRKDLYVYDVVYNRQTQLVKDAKLSGANALTGEGMLVWQGALAFSCWIDGCKAADVIGVMREALDSALKN